jgi:hypothetical protein
MGIIRVAARFGMRVTQADSLGGRDGVVGMDGQSVEGLAMIGREGAGGSGAGFGDAQVP